MPRVGEIVRVFVDGRHDFQRKARVLAVRHDELLVHYYEYNLQTEWIPARWI